MNMKQNIALLAIISLALTAYAKQPVISTPLVSQASSINAQVQPAPPQAPSLRRSSTTTNSTPGHSPPPPTSGRATSPLATNPRRTTRSTPSLRTRADTRVPIGAAVWAAIARPVWASRWGLALVVLRRNWALRHLGLGWFGLLPNRGRVWHRVLLALQVHSLNRCSAACTG